MYPENYIENPSQKIEVYQNIALCSSDEDIKNMLEQNINLFDMSSEMIKEKIELLKAWGWIHE